MNQGTSYVERHYPYAAIYCYNRPLELDSKRSTTYVNRGKVYNELGKIDAAILDFTRAIEVSPYNAEAYRLRGFSWIVKSDYDRAIADCDKAIEVKYALLGNNRQDILNNTFDGEEGDTYWVRGMAYEYKGNLNRALSDYCKAIEIGSHFHLESYYLCRAKLYFKLKEYNKSLVDADKVESLGGKVDPSFLRAIKRALRTKE